MEVLKEIIRVSLDYESEGVASIGYISTKLNTTKYQVKKQIITLLEEGYIIKGLRKGGLCEFSYVPYPPLKGYCITEKAKATELYKITKKEVYEVYQKIFTTWENEEDVGQLTS